MLYLVASPLDASLGSRGDITLAALEILKSCDVLLGESKTEASKLFKFQNLTMPKDFWLMNEHTHEREIAEYVKLAAVKKVALVCDGGTPGFFDPGARLVRLCREQNIPVQACAGISSLMVFLMLLGKEVQNFYFAGFLPQKDPARSLAWTDLQRRKEPIVMMDTPYRLQQLLREIEKTFSNRKISLGMNLSFETQQILEGTAAQILPKVAETKAEFILWLDC